MIPSSNNLYFLKDSIVFAQLTLSNLNCWTCYFVRLSSKSVFCVPTKPLCVHARARTSTQKLTQPWLAESQHERAGRSGDQLAYLSAPHKSGCVLTWCRTQQQNQPKEVQEEEEDRDPGCSAWHKSRARGSQISHSGKNVPDIHVTRAPLSSAHLPRSVCVKARSQRRKTLRALRRQLPSFSLLRASAVGGDHQASPPAGAWLLLLIIFFFTPGSAELWPLRPKAPGHPWG